MLHGEPWPPSESSVIHVVTENKNSPTVTHECRER
jgi:hypothetical protein